MDQTTEMLRYKKALKAMVYDHCVVMFIPHPSAASRPIFEHHDVPAHIQAFEVLGINDGDRVPKGWLDE